MAITWNQTNTDSSPKGGGINWDSSQAGLQHSQGVWDALKGGVNAYSDVLKGLSTGVAKGEVESAVGLGTMTAEGLSKLPSSAPEMKGAPEIGKEILSSDALKSQNIPEAIGKTGERIAEFFAPGGAEKGIMEKGATYINKIPEALGMVDKAGKATKAASFLTKGLMTALKSLVSSGSMAGVTAVQTGGDAEATKGAAKLGAFAGGLSGVLENFGQGFSQSLQKSDFRLTPTKEAKAGKIADQASQFMAKNQILGTSGQKYSKLSSITGSFENALQASLPKDIRVAKQPIIDSMNEQLNILKTEDPAEYEQAKTQIQEVERRLKAQNPGDTTIDIKTALDSKRSWGAKAFKLSGKGKIDPTVSNIGSYAGEQAYQKALEDTLTANDKSIKIPPALQKYFDGKTDVTLPEFNKVYSSAINARNLTQIAQYRNDSGLFGRLFGLWVGKSIGYSITGGLGGEIVGAGLGEAASGNLPAAGRYAAEQVLARPGSPVTTAKILSGATSPDMADQNPQ